MTFLLCTQLCPRIKGVDEKKKDARGDLVPVLEELVAPLQIRLIYPENF